MHAAEDDVVGFRAGGGVLGQLERVTHIIGVHNDFVTLVEVAENQQFATQLVFRVDDALLEFLVACLRVLLAEGLLARGVARDHVERAGTRAVRRFGGVEGPRVFGQAGITGAGRAEPFDNCVYGCHDVPFDGAAGGGCSAIRGETG